MIIHSDVLLLNNVAILIIMVVSELCYRIYTEMDDSDFESEDSLPVKDNAGCSKSHIPAVISPPPVHQGCRHRDRYVEDFLIGSHFSPGHCRRSNLHQLQKQHQTCTAQNGEINIISPKASRDERDEKRLSLLPKLPGCEPDGAAAEEMRKIFPNESIVDIVRYLVARKGNVEQAAAMMKSAVDWHSSSFPSKELEIVPALQTGCFFSHGIALDGTPILFFRGAFYDSKVATPLQYVLAAAYVIDSVMAESDQISVTVLVHACGQKGAPNESADINFIKTFVQILSDNYPERLKRLVIYPFPWFGRALWTVIKMFVDKRSQDKVVLLPGEDIGCPLDLLKYVDINQIPSCCGGLNKDPIEDIAKTILDRKALEKALENSKNDSKNGRDDDNEADIESDNDSDMEDENMDHGNIIASEYQYDDDYDSDAKELAELRIFHSSQIAACLEREEHKDEYMQDMINNKKYQQQ